MVTTNNYYQLLLVIKICELSLNSSIKLVVKILVYLTQGLYKKCVPHKNLIILQFLHNSYGKYIWLFDNNSYKIDEKQINNRQNNIWIRMNKKEGA